MCGVVDMIPQLAMPTSDTGHPSFNRSCTLSPTPRINVCSLGIKCQITAIIHLGGGTMLKKMSNEIVGRC